MDFMYRRIPNKDPPLTTANLTNLKYAIIREFLKIWNRKGGTLCISAIIRDLKISLIIAENGEKMQRGDPLHFLQLLGKFEDP